MWQVLFMESVVLLYLHLSGRRNCSLLVTSSCAAFSEPCMNKHGIGIQFLFLSVLGEQKRTKSQLKFPGQMCLNISSWISWTHWLFHNWQVDLRLSSLSTFYVCLRVLRGDLPCSAKLTLLFLSATRLVCVMLLLSRYLQCDEMLLPCPGTLPVQTGGLLQPPCCLIIPSVGFDSPPRVQLQSVLVLILLHHPGSLLRPKEL